MFLFQALRMKRNADAVARKAGRSAKFRRERLDDEGRGSQHCRLQLLLPSSRLFAAMQVDCAVRGWLQEPRIRARPGCKLGATWLSTYEKRPVASDYGCRKVPESDTSHPLEAELRNCPDVMTLAWSATGQPPSQCTIDLFLQTSLPIPFTSTVAIGTLDHLSIPVAIRLTRRLHCS